jgi:hypothetical protein
MIRVSNKGLQDLEQFFKRAPEAATMAARMAINDTATRQGMTLIKKEMRDEIAFPKGYLAGDRLKVVKRATNQNLEAVILGRKRATSLARFATGPTVFNGKGGVQVRVRNGRTSYLKNAFLVRLRRGSSLDEDNYNIGLALILRPGDVINKKTTHTSWLAEGRVALLYAPSVDQVFRGVSDQVVEPIGDMVTNEFFRQFARLTRG